MILSIRQGQFWYWIQYRYSLNPLLNWILYPKMRNSPSRLNFKYVLNGNQNDFFNSVHSNTIKADICNNITRFQILHLPCVVKQHKTILVESTDTQLSILSTILHSSVSGGPWFLTKFSFLPSPPHLTILWRSITSHAFLQMNLML